MKKILTILGKLIAIALGIWLLQITLHQISWEQLSKLFTTGGLPLGLTIFIYPIACIFHALALRALLKPEDRAQVHFWDIYSVRMIGDSINKMTPFIDIGGEPFKMMLIAKRKLASLPQAVVMVWVSRVSFVLAEIIFIFLGLATLRIFYPDFIGMWVIYTGLVILFIYLGIIITTQFNGVVKIIPRLAKYLKIETNDSLWNEADLGLRTFYGERKIDSLKCLFWQLLGWVAAMFEVYLMFRVLGMDISLIQAFIFQAILQAIKTASFMIPANLGAQEGGLVALALHLGFSATDGFALSLIKRFRQYVWVVFGLCLWKFSRK